MILLRLIEVYCWIAASIFIHEIFHLCTAQILKLSNWKLGLGDKLFSLKFKNIRISPLIIQGYVEVDKEELCKKGRKSILFFFLSGSIGNMLIMTVILLLDYDLKNIVFLVNIVIIITSLCPFMKNSDLGIARQLLKNT